ncbi:MAG: hypothetical protein ACP5NQ_05170, partial [Vulcanisaeta sp.]
MRKLRRKWIETYWRQLLELLDLLERNAIDVIVTRGNSDNKSLAIHLYSKDAVVRIAKVAKSGGITIILTLKGLEGSDVMVDNTFSDKKVIETCRYGFEMTDGSYTSNYPSMGTTQPWQAVLWSLCYPGEVRMRIVGIDINEDGASIRWFLIAKDYEAKPKEEVVKEVKKLGTERLKAFLAPAIWGDGHINANKKSIRLIMGLAKYDLWLGTIERLINELGFAGPYSNEYKVEVRIKSSKAVKLARDWLAVPDLRELIELGAGLPGGEKFKRIIELANMKVREKGGSSVNIPGTDISMSISIDSHCRVNLRAWRKDENEALSLVEELRKAGYNPSMYVCSKGHIISINHTNIRDSPLKPAICQKLSKWLNEISDERRRKKIAKAMRS